MINDARRDRLLEAISRGPLGRQLDEQVEAERSARCAALRGELEAGQTAYMRDLDTMQRKADGLNPRIAALKAEIEPLEKEALKLRWLIGDKQAAMIEHRDRYWAQLTAVADPRIKDYRREFEGRLRGCEMAQRTWQTGPARSVFERPPMASNYAATQLAAQYLLGAIDATVRWAREGLQGEELVRAYEGIMAGFPRIPMGKDDPGVIPEPLP